MTILSRSDGVLGWQDAILGFGGLIGLLVFLLVGPRRHPHSMAAEHIPYQAAIDSARSFTERSGSLSLGGATADATIQLDGDLLNELQDGLGRDAAMQAIREDGIPAYRWHVTWTEEADDGTESLGSTDLTLDGRPLGLEIRSAAIPRDVYHREALTEIFGYAEHPDSLIPNRLDFRLETANGAQSDVGNVSDRSFLDRADAEKLARYHLRESNVWSRDLRVDSIFASGSDGLLTATVQVSSLEDAPGRFFSAEIEVMPTGTLVNLKPRFTQRPSAEEMTFDANALREIGVASLFAIVAVILIIIFFRRVNARLVDMKTSLQDGLLCGTAAAFVVSGQAGGIDLTEPMEVVGVLIGMVIVGGMGGIAMFFISGAAHSLSRERWGDKLQTLALVRSLHLYNIPVGLSLLRGVFGGLTLVGIGALVPVLFSDVAIQFTGSEDVFYDGPYPMLEFFGSVAETIFGAFFLTFAGVLGVGALFHRKRGAETSAFAAVILILCAFQISPIDLRSIPLESLLSGFYGAAIALIFWRFGALETLTAFFVFLLVLPVLPDWIAASTPEYISALLSMGLVGVLVAVGFVGIASGKASSEVPTLIPEYIRDLAQQERLKHELELAREVQLSLLPRSMPEIRGLDLASICLPANEVGGDYYDFFQLGGGKLGVVVGDVSGKGIQAAFYMTLMKGILQSLNLSRTTPADLLGGANEIFRMNAPRGMFMSILLGVIDVKQGTWTCARAGHNPFLIQRAGTELPESIKQNGAAIGLLADRAFSDSIDESTVSIGKGDLLLIYTDGITEAMNQERMLFDESRLKESVANARGMSAADVVASIVRDVDRFCGDAPRHDDMTMVAVRFVGNDDE